MAEHRPILKNSETTYYPPFKFHTQNRYSIPQNGCFVFAYLRKSLSSGVYGIRFSDDTVKVFFAGDVFKNAKETFSLRSVVFGQLRREECKTAWGPPVEEISVIPLNQQ